jgi:tripartite-type tricarboxylate transporter receptor subunit TctC
MLTRRQFTLTAAASIAAAALPGTAALAANITATQVGTQANKPVSLIVSMPKNGPTDMMARFFAEPLAKALGRDVVVDNISGDWGMTGAMIASSAKADGNTLILGTTATHAALPAMTGRYDAIDGFTPVGLMAVSPMVVLVRKDLPFNSLAALQAYMQSSSDHLKVAHGGMGSSSALALHHLKLAFNAPFLQERSYTGTSAALDDLVQGRIDVLCDQMISALPAIRAGKVKAIGITGISRNHAMPGVLTGAQQGFEGLRSSNFVALFAPKGLAAEKQMVLAAALNSVLDDASVARKMREQGLHVPFIEQRGPEQLTELQRREMRDISDTLLAFA